MSTTNEFSFLEVGKVEVEVLPTLIEQDIYKNQNKVFDIVNLKKQTGLIIGAGSVGSNTVATMNKFGFSSFQVYDYDIWEAHNSASSIYNYNHSKDMLRRSKATYNNWYFYPNELRGRAEPECSGFKVDLLKYYLRRQDPQINMEVFRVPFGVDLESAIQTFNAKLIEMEAKTYFDHNGLSLDRSRSNRVAIDILSAIKPDYMVLTTDSLLSRLQCVAMAKQLLIEDFEYTDTFPVIDARTLDTVKGEIYMFDLFNEGDYLKWVNNTMKVDQRFEHISDYENLIYEKKENWHLLELIDLDIVNVCGEKMSVLISQQMAISICNLVSNIFKEKDIINLEGLPKESYINTSMYQPYYAVSKEFVEL
jgi:hypothetical protein